MAISQSGDSIFHVGLMLGVVKLVRVAMVYVMIENILKRIEYGIYLLSSFDVRFVVFTMTGIRNDIDHKDLLRKSHTAQQSTH